MKRFLILLLVVALAITFSFVGCAQQPAAEEPAAEEPAAEEPAAEEPAAEEPAAEEPAEEIVEGKAFSLADIPEIENKSPLNTILETGSTFDLTLPYFEKFTEATGVPINIERIATPVVYSKENVELVAGTGVYDVVYVETAWTDEWAPYMVPLEDLAAQYGSAEEFAADTSFHSPVIMATCRTDGATMTLPFYTYHCGMFLRDDVYEDPTEQANFLEEYGYELAPPVDNEQMTDQAEFFDRKAGEELKGVPLEKDMNGITMQASAFQANDEFSTYLWGNGGDYCEVVKDDSGAVTEYIITKEYTDLMVQTMEEYVGRVQYASPGVLTANFDFVVAAVSQGDSPIVGMMYSNCFAWAVDELNKNVVPNDPDARLGIYPTIGEGPYTGAWSYGVAAASDNQEAAYWLVRYLGSLETQTSVMKDAGQLATRSDVLADPSWHSEENEYPFGILVDYLSYILANEDYAAIIDNAYYFNSASAGKVTEMHMNTLSKGFSGELSPQACIDSLNQQMVDLVTRHDTIPISVEE